VKKVNNYSFSIILLTLLVGILSWATWYNIHEDKEFECWARLHTKINAPRCQERSFIDVFFSFHGNGEGYFLADGNSSCLNQPSKSVGGILNFNYNKQGDYYSIKMRESNPSLSATFKVLTYKDIKLKITKLNSSDYIMTLPNETLLICTED
jgi:hypothetical protein